MKKIIYSLVLFIIGIHHAGANIVLPTTAQNVALNFYTQNTQIKVANLALAYTETSASGDPVYYVFNINGNEGFVIVSAEDAGHPIIGYSTEGSFEVPSETANPEFNFWMKKRKTEIVSVRYSNVQATPEITTEWSCYASGKINPLKTMSVVHTPLVQSKWSQYSGGTPAYNADCPGGSVTGCVATAMAQIMRFWMYPDQGTGSSSYCDCTSKGDQNNYGTLSVNYGSTTYNWSNMPLTTSSADVATLMYHCGVSVAMDYGTGGSYANDYGGNPSSIYAFPTYFKYDPKINVQYQDSFTTAQWNQMLEAEFAAGRPVEYGGNDSLYGGHEWVCDGNDANDMMHINWGWAGTSNGYYAVTDLAPTGQIYNFSQYLDALFFIQPLGLTGTRDLKNNNDISIYPNPTNGPFTIQANNQQLTTNSRIEIYNTIGQNVFSGSMPSSASSAIFQPQLQIDISSQPSGIYILKIINQDGSSAEKKIIRE